MSPMCLLYEHVVAVGFKRACEEGILKSFGSMDIDVGWDTRRVVFGVVK